MKNKEAGIMAWSETKTGGNINSPIREYVCDTEDDVKNLPTKAPQGSTAFCIQEGSVWMKTSGPEWKQI
jgi:hypothetical protein